MALTKMSGIYGNSLQLATSRRLNKVAVTNDAPNRYRPTLNKACEYVGAFSTPIGDPPDPTTDNKLPGIQLAAGFQAIEMMLSTTNK